MSRTRSGNLKNPKQASRTQLTKDKAGAYAAQDDYGELITRVEGSFTNVIGLLMEALAAALVDF